MLKKQIIFLGLVMVISLIVLISQQVYAVKTIEDANSALSTVRGKSGIEESSVTNYAGKIISIALVVTGMLFFGLMLYGGLVWLTSRGEEDRVGKARKAIIAALIGIGLVVSSYAITQFIQQRVINREGAGTPVPTEPNYIGNPESRVNIPPTQ